MTYEERINILDRGIIRMNTYLSYGAAYNDHLDSTGNEARQEAYDVLKKIEATQYSIYSIKNISFDACRRNMFGCDYNSIVAIETNKCNAYKQNINSIINILNQERSRLLKEQTDEEQKKGYEAQIASNKLQKESIFWAKIAAFASIASIILSIILYLCNN